MPRNIILPYNPRLKKLARELRLNSTKAEVILWKNIKNKVFGPQFHRQVPIDEFIVDFFCHELKLAIEVDGSTHDHNFEHDDLRQKKLESFGIKVIRFSDEDVKKYLTEVLRTVQWVIDDLTTSPQPSRRSGTGSSKGEEETSPRPSRRSGTGSSKGEEDHPPSPPAEAGQALQRGRA